MKNGEMKRRRNHFGGIERGFENTNRVDYVKEKASDNNKSLCDRIWREGWRGIAHSSGGE